MNDGYISRSPAKAEYSPLAGETHPLTTDPSRRVSREPIEVRGSVIPLAYDRAVLVSLLGEDVDGARSAVISDSGQFSSVGQTLVLGDQNGGQGLNHSVDRGTCLRGDDLKRLDELDVLVAHDHRRYRPRRRLIAVVHKS